MAPYLTRDPDGSVVRDSDGNALGGLRMPYMEVPSRAIRRRWGNCDETHPAFTDERLAGLYASHDDYMAKIRRAARQAVLDGYRLRKDARSMVRRAMDRPIP